MACKSSKVPALLMSPKFWGVCAYFLLTWLLDDGYVSGNLVLALQGIVATATGVGVLDSVARKVGKK